MMKKFSLFLLLTLVLVLTACSERELTFDRTYPNFAKVDEYREKRQLEIEEEIRNAAKTILETRPTPRSLIITGTTSKYAHASQYCWDNYLECGSRMNPVHPYDSTEIRLSTLTTTNNKLQISIETAREATLPYPTRIEAYIYDRSKNLNLYQSYDLKNNEDIFNVTLPEEPSVYMFHFKTFYTGEVQGLSFHPIMIVKN